MQVLSFSVTLLLLSVCSSIHADDSLRELPVQHSKCWEAHDADAMANLYLEDADHLSSSGVYTQGRDRIRSRYASAFARTRLSNSEHHILDSSVRKISRDVGIVDVAWKMTGLVGDTTTKADDVQGRYCMVAVWTGEAWKIAALRAMVADNAYAAGISRETDHPQKVIDSRLESDSEGAGVEKLSELLDEHRRLWESKDADRLSKLFALDADHVSSLGTVTSGRKAICAGYTHAFSLDRLKHTKHENVSSSIRRISDSVALLDCVWVLTGAKDDDGNLIEKINGRSTVIVKKTGGKWMIVALRAMIPDNAHRAGIEEAD